MSTIPSEDWFAAGKRHCVDAEILASHEPPRLDNADHLVGLGAECLLKALLIGLSPDRAGVTTADGSLARQHWGHINAIWPEIVMHLDGLAAGRMAGLLAGDSPFADFHVTQRYGPDGSGEAGFAAHQRAARRVQRAVDYAALAGEVKLW